MTSPDQKLEMEQALLQQTTLYENLLIAQSDMGDGVAITEGERIVYANNALGKLYGYSVKELLELPSFIELIAAEERPALLEHLRARMSGEGTSSELHATTVIRKDGRRINIEYAVKPTRFKDKTQMFSIIRDVTERKLDHEALRLSLAEVAESRDRERARAEDLRLANQRILAQQLKLVQAEKLSCIGKLAAGVAHEINNPVTGLMACVRLLQTGKATEERQQEYFNVIGDGLKQIATTVNALLSYARNQPAKFSAIDPREVFSSCLPLLAPLLQARRVEIDLQIGDETSILGNSSQLSQATMSVLLNAIHASSPRTKVTVSARREGEWVALQFTDSGRGIPRDQLEHIGEPFFTTQVEGKSLGLGLGLGLAVAKDILLSHGGRLAIDSEEGAGTTVTFWLKSASVVSTIEGASAQPHSAMDSATSRLTEVSG